MFVAVSTLVVLVVAGSTAALPKNIERRQTGPTEPPKNCSLIQCDIPHCEYGMIIYPDPKSGKCCPYCPENPCDSTECPKGNACRVFSLTGEAYCDPDCSVENGGCADNQLCIQALALCINTTSPCRGSVTCVDIHPNTCPNGTLPFLCFPDPCDRATCAGHPNATCVLDNCGGCNTVFFDEEENDVTKSCQPASNGSCLIQGQEFQLCPSCPRTCFNPISECSTECLPGCGCPLGQVINELTNSCVELADCPMFTPPPPTPPHPPPPCPPPPCQLPPNCSNIIQPGPSNPCSCPVCSPDDHEIDCSTVTCQLPKCTYPLPPLPGQCCPRCFGGNNETDCSAVLCLKPNCTNPRPPFPGQCCPRCPPDDSNATNCSAVFCPELNCSNPIPPYPGRCCSRCPQDICKLPPQTGLCEGYFPQYFYNSTSETCEQFIYGGCGGNLNRFPSVKDCKKMCGDTDKEICELPPEVGLCKGYFPQYFYNSTSETCEQFIYGGCGGNMNRFSSVKDCKKKCGDRAPDACDLVKCPVGSSCEFYKPTNETFCQPSCKLDNGGCQDNETCKLVTVQCIRAPCPPVVECTEKKGDKEICNLPPEVGLCRGYFPQYFYNSTSETCEQFIYGGCGGNMNRFPSIKDCKKKCGDKVDCKKVDCGVPSCPDPIPADPANGTCCRTCPPNSTCDIVGQYFQECGSACPATCANPDPLCIEVCSPGCHCPVGQVIDEESGSCVSVDECPGAVPRICKLPAEPGNCRARVHRYYFNLDSGKCESFTYGGCNGNENNFQTLRECRQQCESQGEADCSAVLCPVPTCPNPTPPNRAKGECCSVCPPGSSCPVKGQVFQQCKGCPVTCAEYGIPIPCLLICAPGCACPSGQVIDEQSNTCVPAEQCPGTCELFPEVGSCKAIFPRFFYNATSKQCEKFIYGGCKGNKNNFETLESCEKECSECAPTCTIDFCKGNLQAKCSIPSDETRNTLTCFGACDETVCGACYYSNNTLPLPPLNKDCPKYCPVDASGEIFGMTCLRKWGKCVRKANLDTYGKPSREMKAAENYKCWRPKCPSFG